MNKEKFSSRAWEATVRRSQAAIALTKRGSGGLCGSMSVAHVDDEDNLPTTPESSPERLLANGDLYTGQCADGAPHGVGKYMWVDGCVYLGEWRRGAIMGRGKLCWPGGACYEGDFKNGCMDGKGCYIGANGDIYRGSWMVNLKHGQGAKQFVVGDCYEGEWRRGVQEGHGRYQWKNGNRYVGQWRNGAISGNGVLIWANGNCYDGGWEDGVPKGNGTFKWADGSCYVGHWSKDGNQQNGTYYPFGGGGGSAMEMPTVDGSLMEGGGGDLVKMQRQAMLLSSKGLGKARRSSVEGKLSNGPDKVYVWESDGEVTCDVVDGNAVVGKAEEDLISLHLDGMALKGPRGLPLMLPRVMKQQGETISKGHKTMTLCSICNWVSDLFEKRGDFVRKMAAWHAVGRPAPVTSLDLKRSAFDPKEKVWTRFPSEGSKHTPPHQSCEFKWKDYCPLVFRSLRKLFKVDAADYMLSICGNDALRELSSPGKSGSFFYLTNDDRYMIKTIKKAEVLIRMLKAYYEHVRAFENTLVARFFGLHCVKLTGAIQRKVRFVIMGNLFCSEYFIHRRYDLKGSSHGRTTDKPETEIDENTTLKDLDLNFIFRLQKTWFQEFRRQVDKDCELLESEKIMDYSLLVGLHFRDASSYGALTPKSNGDSESEYAVARVSRADMDDFLCDPARWASIKLGVNMPARVERMVRNSNCDSPLVGEATGEFFDVIMFFGIIDILQDYDITKKIEHAYKSMHYDATSISAVDPRQYSRRFRDFIFKVFAEDT
ncbi:hypothetical protein Sjap_012889 [Stephania japonica]|uniref:Phosphatidylinositol 4-phosphate 5-kinase n=1 Tax=Stephania japonica TaxID=461633 RepID=A0AAP0IYW0_9MAGN